MYVSWSHLDTLVYGMYAASDVVSSSITTAVKAGKENAQNSIQRTKIKTSEEQKGKKILFMRQL